ncbi:MAG: lipocalin-like domain-containing protein [Candidatus Acidiferrales bacterium]
MGPQLVGQREFSPISPPSQQQVTAVAAMQPRQDSPFYPAQIQDAFIKSEEKAMSVEECVEEIVREPLDERAEENPVIGVWKLVSSEATVMHDGKTEVYNTKNPKGYLILTPWQRMMTVSIGGHGDRKKVPTSDADLSELWKSMLAYTGKFRVEGEYLITNVDVAWYELWTGTEQRRKFQLDGDTLTVVTKPQPIGGTGARAKALVSCKVVWEREE